MKIIELYADPENGFSYKVVAEMQKKVVAKHWRNNYGGWEHSGNYFQREAPNSPNPYDEDKLCLVEQ